MLNEWQEFLDYTESVVYQASGKKDTTWLGRFTFEALRDFSGMSRILTILARGFLFHASDGTPLPGDPRGGSVLLMTACVPGAASRSAVMGSKEDWPHHTDFPSLHEQFPKLVDREGWGWFSRHFHGAMRFAASHIRNWSIRTTQLPP